MTVPGVCNSSELSVARQRVVIREPIRGCNIRFGCGFLGLFRLRSLLAMAVFLSGGSVASPGAPETPPPQYAAQKLIAGSVQVAVVSYEPQKAKERYQRALAKGKA